MGCTEWRVCPNIHWPQEYDFISRNVTWWSVYGFGWWRRLNHDVGSFNWPLRYTFDGSYIMHMDTGFQVDIQFSFHFAMNGNYLGWCTTNCTCIISKIFSCCKLKWWRFTPCFWLCWLHGKIMGHNCKYKVAKSWRKVSVFLKYSSFSLILLP